MPASLFSEMERSGSGGLEDQRALQLALELSMLGLNSEGDSLGSSFEGEGRSKKSQNTTECVPVPSSEHVAEIVGRQGCKIKALRAKTNTYIKTPVRGEEPVFVVTGRKEDVNAAKREILSAAEHFSQIRAQRKNNINGSLARGPNSNIPGQTTIQVRVPYRVVGLVVGPKGATIKRIQQQTNTYIVTPSRDKEPVFEVTGLPDNVDSARKEIEAHIAMRTGGIIDSADENDFHSNGIDQAFINNTVGGGGGLNGSGVNGGGGGGNNFSVHSMYKSDLSFAHYNRDGSASGNGVGNNLLTSQEVFTFPPNNNGGGGGVNSTKLSDLYHGFGGGGGGYSLYDTDEGLGDSPTFEAAIIPPSASSGNGVGGSSSLWPEFGTSHHLNHHHHLNNHHLNHHNNNTATIFGDTSNSTSLSRRSSSLSSTGSNPGGGGGSGGGTGSGNLNSLMDPLMLEHPPARRIHSDPLNHVVVGLASFTPLTNSGSSSAGSNGALGGGGGGSSSSGVGGVLMSGFPTGSSSGDSGSAASSPTDSLGRKVKRDCIVCFESEIVSALVPCGHNMFCMECANRICEKVEPTCPVCNQPASQSIRIYS